MLKLTSLFQYRKDDLVHDQGEGAGHPQDLVLGQVHVVELTQRRYPNLYKRLLLNLLSKKKKNRIHNNSLDHVLEKKPSCLK